MVKERRKKKVRDVLSQINMKEEKGKLSLIFYIHFPHEFLLRCENSDMADDCMIVQMMTRAKSIGNDEDESFAAFRTTIGKSAHIL